MAHTIETARLLLRRPTTDDLDALVELDSDPKVMQFLTGGRPTPRAEMETDRLPAWLEYEKQPTGFGFWIAELAATDDFLGWFHMRCKPGLAEDEPELGYRLRKSVWGQGYGTEGSVALIDDAFERGKASRVYAETMAVNIGSRRVMEKCGLEFVRSFHLEWEDPIKGSELGEVEYEITRNQWMAKR